MSLGAVKTRTRYSKNRTIRLEITENRTIQFQFCPVQSISQSMISFYALKFLQMIVYCFETEQKILIIMQHISEITKKQTSKFRVCWYIYFYYEQKFRMSRNFIKRVVDCLDVNPKSTVDTELSVWEYKYKSALIFFFSYYIIKLTQY